MQPLFGDESVFSPRVLPPLSGGERGFIPEQRLDTKHTGKVEGIQKNAYTSENKTKDIRTVCYYVRERKEN